MSFGIVIDAHQAANTQADGMHLAVVLLEYYYSGEYEFWMKEGEIMFRSIELDDDMNNPQDTEYDDE